MRTTHDRKDRFLLVACGDARRIVRVVAIARIKVHAVHRNPASDGDLMLRRINQLVPLVQVVGLRRLVVNVGYDAVELRAERVVRRDIRKAASCEHANVGRLPV